MREGTRGAACRLALSVSEAADAIGIGRTKAWELVSAGALPVVRLGKSVIVPVFALEEFLQAHVEGGVARERQGRGVDLPPERRKVVRRGTRRRPEAHPLRVHEGGGGQSPP
jgi:excisionase family DNA binding protein